MSLFVDPTSKSGEAQGMNGGSSSGNSGVSDIHISVCSTSTYCTPYGVRRWDGMRWGSGEIKPSSDIHPIPFHPVPVPVNVAGRVWGGCIHAHAVRSP